MLCKVLLCGIKHPPTRDKATGLRAPRANPGRRRTLSGHFAILSGPGIRRKAPQRARRGTDRTKCGDPRECRKRSITRTRPSSQVDRVPELQRRFSLDWLMLPLHGSRVCLGSSTPLAHPRHFQSPRLPGVAELPRQREEFGARGASRHPRELGQSDRSPGATDVFPLEPREWTDSCGDPRGSSVRSLLIAPARGAAPKYEGPVRLSMISPAHGDTEVRE
jgi:hypothetical protein